MPVTFPNLQPPEPSPTSPPAWSRCETGITAHFLRLKKPTDVTEDTLALLNVTFEYDCDFETLLSSLPNNAQLHLPPRSWLASPTPEQHPHPTNPTAALLSNGRRVPDQRDFHTRARELSFNNSDAFSTLSRKGNGSKVPLRLAHYRKFWEGLDNLAYYWDTSLDEYFPSLPEATQSSGDTALDLSSGRTDSRNQVIASETDSSKYEPGLGTSDEPRKKAKTEAVNNEALSQSINSNGFAMGVTPTYSSPSISSRMLPARNAPSKIPGSTDVKDQNRSANPSGSSYRGYRIGNGSEMPDQYRIDCVRAFLEPIAWAFGVTLSPHRRPPVLTLEHVRFPVRMSSVAWRGPQDRTKARQGWMEGPVLGVQCRADVNFGKTGNLRAESVLDAVRELGGLLLLAQERARESQVERRAGEGKWWTTRERWGGGPGGEVDEASETSDLSLNNPSSRPEDGPVERNRDGSKSRRRPTPAEAWKILKAGSPLWDPKITYEAIGKDKSVQWDDVCARVTYFRWLPIANTMYRSLWCHR